jgi:potassium uptake TrkH family protein
MNCVTLLMAIRMVLELFIRKKAWVRVLGLLAVAFLVLMALFILPAKSGMAATDSNRFLVYKLLLYVGITFIFITEFSHFVQLVYSRALNPGGILVGSFAFFIICGTFLLKLPNATYGGISTINALFTSTSAVCVTGLTVVDTGTHFTPFGHMIIMLLIQVGGLGIMTFAGILAYAVAGQASIKAQLAFKDMVNSKKINNVMQFLYHVILVTFLFELFGAICIYVSLDDTLFERKLDRIFFSVFHSVSAFCNAGFSTYSGGLHEPVIRFNYPLHLIIAFLIILGGLGFPIVFNFYKYLRIKLINLYRGLTGDVTREHFPSLNFINAKLALMVSGFLLALGFVCFILFEEQASLREHPGWTGKVVTSFFASVTTRTAGFNTVDMGAITMPTIMIHLLLMYIGASPGSTGGGIKTTTAGLAVLNMVAVLRGRDRTDFMRAEVSHQSVRRAFAIILLSLLCMGIAIFFIAMNDSKKGLIAIAFEVFSAFSTTGLSLGITPHLTVYSKIVVIITMFIGRVGMITLLVAFIRQSKQIYYRYPKEEIAF